MEEPREYSPELLAAADEVSERFCVAFAEIIHPRADTGLQVFDSLQQGLWFYSDSLRPASGDTLPTLRLRDLAAILFQHSPYLQRWSAYRQQWYDAFKTHLRSVPVAGAVLLNCTADRVLLVLNYERTLWNFPKGKINEGESFGDCAIREVFEEAGADIAARVGRNTPYIRKHFAGKGHVFLVVRGIPERDYAPTVEKEIAECRWFDLASLPSQSPRKPFRSVLDLLPDILKVIETKRPIDYNPRSVSGQRTENVLSQTAPATPSQPQPSPHTSAAKPTRSVRKTPRPTQSDNNAHRRGPSNSARASHAGGGSYVGSAGLSETFGDEATEGAQWSVQDMFERNSQLTGQTFTYDGNPQTFGDVSPTHRPLPRPRDQQPPQAAVLQAEGVCVEARAKAGLFEGAKRPFPEPFVFDRAPVLAAIVAAVGQG